MNFSGVRVSTFNACIANRVIHRVTFVDVLMRKGRALISFALVCVLVFLGLCPQYAAAQTTALSDVVQRDGEAFVRDGKADGLSIAIVWNGQVRYFNFGTTVRGTAKRPTQDTVYEIGSISKTFTSLLLAHAVLEKKVRASDDIRRYMPGSYANLQFKGAPIALSDLAATTSALPDNLPDFMPLLAKLGARQAPFAIMDMLQPYSGAQLLQDLHKVELSCKPGTTPAHSNVAPELLGLILERLYGRSYQDLLASYIETPLAMRGGVAKDRLSQMARGYMVGDKAMPLLSTVDFILPAGGLRYSTSDMAKYVAYQLDEVDQAVAMTHQVLWSEPGKDAVGFNWTIARMKNGMTRLSHSGGTFGFSSFVDLYPSAHYGIVLLTNRSGPMTQDQLAALSEQIVHSVTERPGI